MSELEEILTALRNEICEAIPDGRPEKATIQAYFARCLELAGEPESVQLAKLRGKVEAYETAISLLKRI